MAKVMLVCCYGNYDAKLREPEVMEGLYWYIRGIVPLITSHQPDYVVLCGGHTEAKATESEAASMRPELERVSASGPTFLLEERSANTQENLSFGFDQAVRLGEGIHELIVVSDHVRRWNVRLLMLKMLGPSGTTKALSVFGSNIPWKVVGLHRQDVHPNSTRRRQLLKTLKFMFQQGETIFP